ncbi:hypothetical protein [Arcobacter sp. CECT 8985]|uniref:hypothetical protein n=1 Tax=Arcobacter sp. CECT 8985 TaxID=1935424 RepID=UPI00100A8D62|nr:hypothetical protein [Arcobacter sp. CECT 8985]RXJ86953.1 hypothetical protein CRU93_06110 [Arcobacter sp. CECT 8985]
MSDLIEKSEFTAGIYQIETNDDVLGGENGIANAQAKALANRTLWLKTQVALKALLNGSATEKFKVADATADDEAVSKSQMENALSVTSLAAKTALADADEFVISDSKDTNNRKKTSWSNIKTKIRGYLLTGYSANFTRAKGHLRLPDMFGNFTINWGSLTVNASVETYINLDLAYDTVHLIALCSSGGDVLGTHDAQIEIAGKTQVLLGTTQQEIVSWFSIGK